MAIKNGRQKGATLLELMLVVGLLGAATLLAFSEKQIEIEQQKARVVGLQLSQYNNAIRSYIAKNASITNAQKSGSAWLKSTSCGGPYAPGTEFLPCDFPAATIADPIDFGMLSFSTSIVVTGAGTARSISATTTTGQFSVASGGGAMKPRSDLAGIAALTAASATQTGYKNNGNGGLSPYGAATDASYKSNPLDARITMVAANKADNDVWLRTDGGNKMHAPLRFDSSDPLNRTIVGASRIQNLAGEVLYLGAPSGLYPASAARVVADADTEIIGNLRVRAAAVVDGAIAAGGSITTQGHVSAAGSVSAAGNVSASGSVIAGSNVSASGSVTAQANVSASGSVTAAGNVYASGHVLAGQSVQAQIFYDSNNTGFYVDPASVSVLNALQSNNITNLGSLESKGRVYAREHVALGAVVTEGWGCDTNGLIGRDASGKTLSCQNGLWASNGGGAPTCQAINIPGNKALDVTTYQCPAGFTKTGWDTTGQGWRQSSTPGLIIGANDWSVVFCCKY
jgi:type II secretory pathway pseudopilin PulG